jgi:UDP-N-acetylglucosamine diphosphorylase/glucosamine-1-phosphate N-acetyltransferase
LFIFTHPNAMDKIIFTEEFCQPENLHPFTLTRQLQDLRVGILTIREKWEAALNLPSFDKKEDDYKDLGRSVHIDEAVKEGTCYLIHGNLLPSKSLLKAIRKLNDGDFVAGKDGNALVYKFSSQKVIDRHKIRVGNAITLKEEAYMIRYPWDILKLNGQAIRDDFKTLTRGKKSRRIPGTNRVSDTSKVFLEKGAWVENCIINSDEGPVYLGKNAMVMEGTMIRGPVAIGEGSCVKMGTRIYAATTIGSSCLVGGEIKNSIFLGYSNKAHDGYLGDSIIGEWCNLGAGTTNSNLKNTAGEVRVWTQHGERTAGIKCGVMMGDYSRTVINTSINTGTVIGVCCHVQGTGLTPRYIPNFSWGSEGVNRYELDKAIRDITAWKKLKGLEMNDEELSILRYIFDRY